MKNLLYKEFKLSIAAGFFLLPLLGALLLIPQWIFFLALMYCMFITIPNIFTSSKTQNDVGFSVMLPVRKRDVVKAKIAAVVVMELLHIIVAAIFAALNLILYKENNFLMNPNAAFFGFVFMMFAVFNIVFFPGFYKTGYKVAVPVVAAMIAALVFSVAAEALMFLPAVKEYIGGRQINGWQFIVLLAGIALFALVTVLSYRMSAKRFEKIDL